MADNRLKKPSIVCLGGGIGTVTLLSGLKNYACDLTAVVSMADDGGSSGRLRRLYGAFPPGDVISCLSALSTNAEISQLLTYRFAGDRYGKDAELGGHKLGNLFLTALADIEGDFETAIRRLQSLFSIPGTILPATRGPVMLSAKTIQNRYVYGEEKIDLGKYLGKRILESVSLHPARPKAGKGVVESILHADVIVLGPGDLYTAQLPVVIIPEITEAVKKSKAKKIYVVNVANKPFETRGYSVQDYIEAVRRHMDCFPFSTVILNNNYEEEIPKKFHYKYVKSKKRDEVSEITFVERNLVRKDFPLYHDPQKLAKAVWDNI